VHAVGYEPLGICGGGDVEGGAPGSEVGKHDATGAVVSKE
jgi:hypothetical protein